MSSPSLFGRLTRFAYNPRRQPHEERLTEAFAATLQASQPATVALLRGLGAKPGGLDDPFDVITQRYTAGGDRVDVEVRFGPVSRPTLIVWLELKWSAKPDAGQLHRYANALATMPGDSDLVLIAPHHVKLSTSVPGVHGTWQETGAVLARWLARARENDPYDHHHGTAMVGAFIDYLEENELAMTGAFTLTDALALNNFAGARSRIGQVIAQAHRDLEAVTVPGAAPGWDEVAWDHGRDPQEFWRSYRAPTSVAGAPAVRWFEFHGRKDDNRARSRGDAVFGAGLTTTVEDAFDESYTEWMADMRAKGFEYGGDGEHMYLFRYRYPAELVAGADVEEQGALLATWVMETFALLEASPPQPVD